MNKKLASIYLKLLGRPTIGLDTLTWITTKSILEILNKYKTLKLSI